MSLKSAVLAMFGLLLLVGGCSAVRSDELPTAYYSVVEVDPANCEASAEAIGRRFQADLSAYYGGTLSRKSLRVHRSLSDYEGEVEDLPAVQLSEATPINLFASYSNSYSQAVLAAQRNGDAVEICTGDEYRAGIARFLSVENEERLARESFIAGRDGVTVVDLMVEGFEGSRRGLVANG